MFDWGEFLVLAKKLLSDNDSNEAYYRSAISRAYYFAYHNSLEFCKYCGISIPSSVQLVGRPDSSRHVVLIETLKGSQDAKIRAFGRKLKILRDKRNTADYDGNPYEPHNLKPDSEAKFVITEAEALKDAMVNFRL